jgi:hypothetical protein
MPNRTLLGDVAQFEVHWFWIKVIELESQRQRGNYGDTSLYFPQAEIKQGGRSLLLVIPNGRVALAE